MSETVNVDVAIFGGGVAGLWTLARLRNAGYNAILLEKESLGAGQTRYAQGIIHGGTKYALTGKLTASSESIASMPSFWRDCLDGNVTDDEHLDLSAVKLMASNQNMWSTASLTSRMAGFFASHAMRSRTEALSEAERPGVFRHKQFKGQVYRLDEPVLDTASLVKALAQPHIKAIVHYAKAEFDKNVPASFELTTVDDRAYQVTAKKVVLAAGKGNADILASLGKQQPVMQLRPLQMVMVRGGLPDMLYAHCLGASVNPRITITSHLDSQGDIVWYLGGQLAEEGVDRSAEQQVGEAKKELTALMPWLDLSQCQWATLPIDRAEPKMAGGKRPDDVFISNDGNVLTTWPTKLALSPRLASQVVEQLAKDNIDASGLQALPAWPAPAFALLPWQEEQRWQ